MASTANIWILRCLLFFVLLDNTICRTRLGRTSRGKKGPYVTDPECPRKADLAQGRRCFKKCRTDLDCKGRNKRCLCDDVCGKSCVKPNRRCETLGDVLSGKVAITRFNTFGAKARYTCDEGYILSGQPERVCQGDGRWSGDPPTCDTEGKCGAAPVVPQAHHDRPRDQKVFPLGTKLTYSCANGYNIYGFYRAMCVQEGRWVGARMSCSPRRCGHPGDIPNGDREGSVFFYPSRVTYVCQKGHELVGRSFRVCQANGQWSGTLPMCRPVKCPSLGRPVNGEMMGRDNKFGAEVNFTCGRGFTLVGSRARRCEQSGIWSGKEATCALVDCGMPKPLYLGYLDGKRTTFGAVMEYRCFGWTTFAGESKNTTCEENGEWSHPVAHCWAKCKVPAIDHGNPVNLEDYRVHMTMLDYACEGSTHQKVNDSMPQCYNGTWSFMPTCVPQSCKNRPPDIRDGSGMVRYYSNNHGSKAKYKCNTGYKRVGDEYMICLHGNWSGKQPHCSPLYCKYPGTIVNGQVLLVGAIGKYEYRSYVRRIGHTEQIEFHCEKGHKRVGPPGATCVDGNWSPAVMPKCIPGQHPKLLELFRGKRSLEDDDEEVVDEDGVEHEDDDMPFAAEEYCQVPSVHFGAVRNHLSKSYVVPGATLDVRCDAGYKLNLMNLPSRGEQQQQPRCHNGAWSDMVRCVPGKWLRHAAVKCTRPNPVMNGDIHLVSIEERFLLPVHYRHLLHGTELEFTCQPGYELLGTAGAVCDNGSWSPAKEPFCSPSTGTGDSGEREMGLCEVPDIPDAVLYPEVGYYVAHGTTLHLICGTGHVVTTEEQPLCDDGVWTVVPQCLPSDRPTETARGS